MSIPLGVVAYPTAGGKASSRIPQGPESTRRSLATATQRPDKPSRSSSVRLRSRVIPQIFRGKQPSIASKSPPIRDTVSGIEDSRPSRSGLPVAIKHDSTQIISRGKHIPIITAQYTTESVSTPAKPNIPGDSLDRPVEASTISLAIPHFPLSRAERSSSPVKRQPRHVEVGKADEVQSISARTPTTLGSKSFRNSGKSSIGSKETAMSMSEASSRTSTLDSTTSAPSHDQLYEPKGSTNRLSVNSSQASFVRQADNDVSEHDSAQDALAPTTPQLGRSAGASPSLGTAANSTNLSGLVCNVHRTTGKEPHPLVGATTTILGDKLYVFGGRRISRSRPNLTSELWELDLLRRHWIKVETKGDAPSPRYFHSVCALGDNKLVCYGGMSPEPSAVQNGHGQNDPEAQVSVMSDIHIYDAPSSTWTKILTSDAPQGRYAHCAAILPSSAVFASANAPLSALHHNPAGSNTNQGTLGVQIDGTGGAEMIVVGGQDSANRYIEQISVFNLRSLKWTSIRPMSGRSCGAYRSVVTPLTSMSVANIGAGYERGEDEDEDEADEADASVSGSPMLIYTNYNFLDVKLELQIRMPDGSLIDKAMHGPVSPPGLRFPSGGIIDHNFVVAGTFLTSSKQEFSLWALDLRTLGWARIDTGSNIFSQGSWNRGVIWNRRNAFVILGNRKRNLVEDYNNRRLNFSNMCIVQLEAFGLYDSPRRTSPTSNYISGSAPTVPFIKDVGNSVGGRQLGTAAEEIGQLLLASGEFADMDFLSIDGTRIPVNSRLISRRWGPSFNSLLRDGMSPSDAPDSATLRPSTSNLPSRNSSITITPSVSSNATTLTANSGFSAVSEPADPRLLPPNLRSRTLYLPHTVHTIHALLLYLYTSTLPAPPSPLATPQIFCSLLQLARPYQIDGLLEATIERLHETLDGRNAAAIFNAAAMGAGGGEGLAYAISTPNAHPPRTASLAGIENLNLNGIRPASLLGSGRNLRIDTEAANGSLNGSNENRNTLRPGGDADHEEEERQPGSASTTGSLRSHLSMMGENLRLKRDGPVWDGSWSAVIGLQKRGLRGLMEGRRIRERGRSEGVNNMNAAETAA